MQKESCINCPYFKDNPHSKKWPNYVDKMEASGLIQDKRHVCHSKGNVWGKITEENVCIGSLKRNKILINR